MIDALPDRPVTLDELDEIREAGGYELVRPGGVRFGPDHDDATEEIVIVASKWFGALQRESDGWRQVFREDREPDEDPELLYMVAMEELGLTDEHLP